MALRQRRPDSDGTPPSEDAAPPAAAAAARRQQPAPRARPRTLALLLATALAAAGVATSQAPQLQQQLTALLEPLSQHLPQPLQQLVQRLADAAARGGGPAPPRSGKGKLFSAEELGVFTSDNPRGGGKIYVAILGEVFDVSAAPQFYGAGNGYGHFAGTDGSKSFITGDFVGDVTDDVSSLDAESCLGLVGWLEFYHKTYPFVGRRVGRFYGADGRPTAALASVHARADEGRKVKAKEVDELALWPNCNSKYTEAEGGRVWCEGGRYPRKLFVDMKNGRPTWRCACFEELGWSDVRQVYPECEPSEHSCSTAGLTPEALRAADEAVLALHSMTQQQ